MPLQLSGSGGKGGLEPGTHVLWRGSIPDFAAQLRAFITRDELRALGQVLLGDESRYHSSAAPSEPHVVWRGSASDLATDLRALLPAPAQIELARLLVKFTRSVVRLLLWCPECGERHIDEGAFAVKEHHTHACQECGHVWRPAIEPTVGVRFLPGFKNEPSKPVPG